MAFVNEEISTEDIQKYNIHLIGGASTQWTIDRDLEMYLHKIRGGGRDIERSHISEWIFLWHGYLLYIEIHLMEAKEVNKEFGWSHKKVTALQIYDSSKSQRIPFPFEMKGSRDEIFVDLKKALLEYKDTGIFSNYTQYELMLDVELKGDDYVIHL